MTAFLSVASVTKKYQDRRVLSGVSFDVDCGEAVGIIGPNGAGKTTMIRVVMGLIAANSGSVRLDGEPVVSAQARIRCAYFGGESTLPPGVRARSWRNLFHDVDDHGENRPLRLLSRGTRQLLGLRTVFSIDGIRLLALDEPWEGLDPDATRWLTESLRARCDAGTTLLISSHRLHDLAGVCDRYIFLNRGIATAVSAETLARNGTVDGDALVAAFDAVRGRTP